MRKIHILVGMIASGKSTYCTNAVKHRAIICNDDDVVNMLHANDYTQYDKGLKILYKSIENEIISLGLCLGRTVIVDRGLNVSKKGRQRWIALAKSFDVPCEAIIFPKDTPLVHSTRRFDSDSRGHSYEYWLDVANAHNRIYQEPTLDEGFDRIYYVNFDDVKGGKFIG